jgi:S-(hydroxymethyl)mycothiol dehydrogenase
MACEGKAAVLQEAGKDAEIIDTIVDSPGPGEVMVRLVASGVCHTDLTVKNLNGNGMKFPIVLGHEGAGFIEEVGEGVSHLQKGDPVVIAYRAPCDQCPACRRGDPRHCYMALRPQPRITGPATANCARRCCAAAPFATLTVVHSKAAIKMPAEMPLDKGVLDRLRRRHRRGRGHEHQSRVSRRARGRDRLRRRRPVRHSGRQTPARPPDHRR